MWAFFIALFGSIIYAAVKLYDAFNGYSSAIRRRDAKEEAREKYSGLRIKNGEFNGHIIDGNTLYRRRFDELSTKDLTELLSEDFSYIAECECGEDYFQEVLQLSDSYKDTLRYVWLSKLYLIESSFLSGSTRLSKFKVFLPEHKDTIIYSSDIVAQTRIRKTQIRTLECIERNLRRRYPELRFVFIKEANIDDFYCLDIKLEHEELDIDKRYTKYYWQNSVTASDSAWGNDGLCNQSQFTSMMDSDDKATIIGIGLTLLVVALLISVPLLM